MIGVIESEQVGVRLLEIGWTEAGRGTLPKPARLKGYLETTPVTAVRVAPAWTVRDRAIEADRREPIEEPPVTRPSGA